MVRQPVSQLTWREQGHDETAEAYLIRLDAPGRWHLLAHGRSVGVYPTKSAARQAADHRRQQHLLRRRLIGSLLVLGVSLACLGLALANRTEPNPEYPATRAVADRFDRAQAAVEAGQIDLSQVTEQFPGIEGGSFEHAGRLKQGLAGVFDGACYGMVWRTGFGISGVAFRRDFVTCRPDASLIDQPDPPGLVAEPIRPSWEYALPESTRTRVWFIPVVSVSIGLVLVAATRATGLVFGLRRLPRGSIQSVP